MARRKKQKHNKRGKEKTRLALLADGLGVSKATVAAFLRSVQAIGCDGSAPIRLSKEAEYLLDANRETLLAMERGEITARQLRFYKSGPVIEPMKEKKKMWVRIIYTPMGGKR